MNGSNAAILHFHDNDLVYGPKAEGKLREWQERYGGKLIEDVHDPFDDGFNDWITRSVNILNKFTNRGSIIHFDLTHVVDIENVLNGKGKYAKTVTTGELRYIRDNWTRLSKSVKFYKNNTEVNAPWQS